MFFSREPDYQEGDFSAAVIHFEKDSATQKKLPFAYFTLPHHLYKVAADYPFKSFAEGEKTKVIYDIGNPQKASVYSLWGYWIRWKELLAFLVLFFLAYQAAAAVTSNPTPEAVIEEIEGMKPKPKRRKYDL